MYMPLTCTKGAKIEAEDCLQKERDIISNKSVLAQMQRADAESRAESILCDLYSCLELFDIG